MVIGIDGSRAFTRERTGTENYSYHLITHMLALPEAVAHIFVLFTRPNALISPEIRRYANVKVATVPWKYLWTQGGLAGETYNKFQIPNSKFQTGAKKQLLDVLWIPAHTLPILRRPGLKTVVTIHGLEYRWLPEYRNLLQRWYLPLSTYYAARHADRLICVSQATQRDLVAETQIDIEKTIVIGEGVTRIANNELRISNIVRQKVYAQYGIRHSEYVLFVGTVQPRKNVASLIAAFARARLPRHYKLVISGAIGWMAAADLAAPHEFEIQDRVIFTGRVSEVELLTLYQGAALYVQPSWTEGFGLPVLEAMQAGVPVITSDGGALPEVVGKAGVVVRLGDGFVARLARAIERVVGDPVVRQQLVAAGHARARRFTWERAARATLTSLVTV